MWKEAVVSVVFAMTSLCVVRPINIRLKGGSSICFNFVTAPVLAVVLLRFLDLLTWGDIWRGVWGVSPLLRPLAIANIFYTLAYISISVDVTGVLEAFALWVLEKSGRDSQK
eukprot:PhF_6_TR3698/c0_g1_i1/m.5271